MPESFLYNEKDLLLRVSQGEEDAFRQLFNRYRGKLYSYLLKITESKESAEDTVHDVFLKIWMNKEKLTEIQNLNAYLYRMAHNHAFNGLRRMAKETLIMAELENRAKHFSTDPGETLVRKEIREFINNAVNKLTPQQKEVFRLSRELGLKQEAIAQQLGISIFTVKTHLRDAMNYLRKEIARSYGSYAIALFVIYSLHS